MDQWVYLVGGEAKWGFWYGDLLWYFNVDFRGLWYRRKSDHKREWFCGLQWGVWDVTFIVKYHNLEEYHSN